MIAAALLPACFYSDPINERPSADINQVNPELPFRGDAIDVQPFIIDPNGDPTYTDWAAFACESANVERCDPVPYVTGNQYGFSFDAPVLTDRGLPAVLVHIELDVTDEWGAKASPRQMLDVPLADRDPELEPLQPDCYAFEGRCPVGVPAKISAKATDGDDTGALAFTDEIEVFPPAGIPQTAATVTRIDVGDGDGEATWEITATEPGDWSVRVEVVDPLDNPLDETARHHDTIDLPIAFEPDKQPCIGVTEPALPPEGAAVIVDQLRRFSVLEVRDDRDAYPTERGPIEWFGLSHFRWFLDGQQLGVDGNFVDIDPALYTPGTLLDLRVEAVDREDQPLCDGSLATCEDRPGCFQRRSWTLEVR